MEKLHKLVQTYRKKLYEIERQNIQEIPKLKQSIKLTKKYLNLLRIEVRNNTFTSQQQEIKFFKETKPNIQGLLKYFLEQLSYHVDKPKNPSKQKSFLKNKIKQLEKKKSTDLAFYRYYKQGCDSLDDKFFIRGNEQLAMFGNENYIETDPQFTTSFDLKVASIIAYELITAFYTKELKQISVVLGSNVPNNSGADKSAINLDWTGTKTELIELIYALKAASVISFGNSSVLDIAKVFSMSFNIDLSNMYKTYADIKKRKKAPTKFINTLQQKLAFKITYDANN